MPKQRKTSTLCPCDSGLAYEVCCGCRSRSSKDIRRQKEHVFLLYQDATNAIRGGREMHCLSAVKEILNLQPFHFGALALLFNCKNQLNVFSITELGDIAENILDGYPGNIELRCASADVFEFTGRIDKAVEIYQGLLRDDAHNFRAHFGLGRTAQRRHQLDQAEFHFRHAFYVRRVAPHVLRNLAGVLSAMGRKSESEHYFKIALAQSPRDTESLLAWTRMEESRGNMKQAWRLIDMVPLEAQNQPVVKLTRAVLHRRAKNFKRSLLIMDDLDTHELHPINRANYWFERCYTLDKLGLHDQAFGCARRANEIKENELGLRYDEKRHQDAAKKLKRAFVKKRLSQSSPATPIAPDEEEPIFICGFTRSGTSMVEQILSAHPNISGGDELPFIYDLAHNARVILQSDKQFPDCLFERQNGQEPSACQLLRGRYLERLRLTGAIEPGVRRVTDKMPMNEMHLGLINLLFPESKVVHVVRHPLDSVMSTYFTDASHGGFCSYGLVSAAKHFRLLFQMTKHYREKMDLDLHRVRYEDIVSNVQKEVKKLLAFVEEPFHQGCVDFHENPRFSRTASYAQVMEKLYDSSVYRYRNYRKHVEEIIPILRPVINELGYKV